MRRLLAAVGFCSCSLRAARAGDGLRAAVGELLRRRLRAAGRRRLATTERRRARRTTSTSWRSTSATSTASRSAANTWSASATSSTRGLGVGYLPAHACRASTPTSSTTNGSEIEQDLKLRIVPFTATFRFLPFGRSRGGSSRTSAAASASSTGATARPASSSTSDGSDLPRHVRRQRARRPAR